ncbi:helix-turn-helix domain-containing protein [Corynebacterium amycolatum]|uniref:helix-turn-helix domain-containing protein n=1 Tax=Corynebacterium amycolatum TaxID=43765 RepID=UPI002159E1E8|nr:helix-turn-helix transcriptional regulator [Corynebacterium amycolatum]UVE00691.1 helix-turn-helix transcriptional regulator [Corynebacterium amycolatum]
MTIDSQELNRRIGTVVRRERERQELTQAELAERLGDVIGAPVARMAVGRIEAGTRPVTLPEMKAIQVVLGLSPKDLLAGRRTPAPLALLDDATERAQVTQARLERESKENAFWLRNLQLGRDALTRVLAVAEGVDHTAESLAEFDRCVALALVVLEEAGVPLPAYAILEMLGIPDSAYTPRERESGARELAATIRERCNIPDS